MQLHAPPHDSIKPRFRSSSIDARRPAWRFTLGSLFRATAVSALTMFAAVQFGPLAAARVLGIGLAVVFAIHAWNLRRHRWWFAAAAVALLGCVPTILAAGAPFSHRSAVCLECGLGRETHQVCGWTTSDEISESDISRWAAPLVPAGHQHVWATTSLHQRTQWFTSAPIGCGGPAEGAFMAWQLARLGDQHGAEQLFREYQDILAGRSSKSMATHRQEASAAVEAALQARR
jgi:hypothetical protein